MIPCKYVEKWQADPCTARTECLSECRAGWTAQPVPCEVCGKPTCGPFTATIVDEGGEDVLFRLACLDCAPAQAALDAAIRTGFATVAWMTRPDRGRR